MQIVRLGGTAWLVRDDKQGIIVDASKAKSAKVINRRIKDLDIRIPLIFLTHTHYDHSGGMAALRAATGAKVMVGAAEADCLRSGYTPVPKGTHAIGRFLSGAAHTLTSKTCEHYVPVTQDVIPIDTRRTLEEFGFDADVLPLGAHTKGSIGLHIGDYFFAGDNVFGIGHVIYPPFADEPEQIRTAWEIILNSRAKLICPGHGPMIKRDILKKHYTSRFGKLL